MLVDPTLDNDYNSKISIPEEGNDCVYMLKTGALSTLPCNLPMCYHCISDKVENKTKKQFSTSNLKTICMYTDFRHMNCTKVQKYNLGDR